MSKKIAICQPYFAPHLAYFKLINAVDIFVSYDDVNYITRGWINRNKIIVNGDEKIFTIPLKHQSQFKKINEIEIDWNNRDIGKLFKTLKLNYSKSPFVEDVMQIISNVFDKKPELISTLALVSIKEFCKYLDIETEIKESSVERYEKTDGRAQNLINICKSENANHYINPIGGVELYCKDEFRQQGVDLSFLDGSSGLSIIDVCMNTPKEEIQKQLKEYRLL
tara:strand:+ start:3984 stop:4652 length:669 start_codon:yes stop_codon:yes gene_type:complete